MLNHVDIIIVNYNTAVFLERCLKNIKKNTFYPYKLIIIDNQSTDNSKRYLKKLQTQRIQVIYNQKNLGTSKAWNQGIKAGHSKYILVLNPDTLVPKGWLKKLVACAESDSQIAVVGAKLVNKDGIITHAGIVEKNGQRYGEGLGERDNPNKYAQIRDCLTVCGACYLIKRANLKHIGYFDEKYFMYTEETDYSFRARLLGYRVVRCPLTIIHFGEGSPLDQTKRRQIHQQSLKYFREKWAHAEKIKKILAPQILKTKNLIKGERAAVYFLYDGQKHLIPNKDIFFRLGFKWQDVKVIPQRQVDQIPRGIIIYI